MELFLFLSDEILFNFWKDIVEVGHAVLELFGIFLDGWKKQELSLIDFFD